MNIFLDFYYCWLLKYFQLKWIFLTLHINNGITSQLWNAFEQFKQMEKQKHSYSNSCHFFVYIFYSFLHHLFATETAFSWFPQCVIKHYIFIFSATFLSERERLNNNTSHTSLASFLSHNWIQIYRKKIFHFVSTYNLTN